MKTLIISGSPRKNSHSIEIAKLISKYLKEAKEEHEILDLAEKVLDPFKGHDYDYSEETQKIIVSLKDFSLFIIVTPIYNSSFSSAVKNVFEHAYYKDLKGKTAAFVTVSSGKITSIHVKNQLASMVGYFNIFTHPKAVYVVEDDFEEKEIKNEDIRDRLKDLAEDSIDFAKRLSR